NRRLPCRRTRFFVCHRDGIFRSRKGSRVICFCNASSFRFRSASVTVFERLTIEIMGFIDYLLLFITADFSLRRRRIRNLTRKCSARILDYSYPSAKMLPLTWMGDELYLSAPHVLDLSAAARLLHWDDCQLNY